ncbi:MAG TPA: helix-turn-helix domain-containing protein [Gaiellaceae bacterium]|nr:helix-turn-helix domain-containing protein [Gaiellaceae bacterium]
MTLRADAQRNFDRVLDVAGECFGERGFDVTVAEIARRAGVGHGTVFRRFASKEELVVAVVCRHLRELTASAERAAEDDDAWRGFERFLREACERYAANQGLVGGLDRCVGAPEKGRLLAAVEKLVRRARRAGVLRPGLAAEDVLALVPTAARYPDVVLDGLRAR